MPTMIEDDGEEIEVKSQVKIAIPKYKKTYTSHSVTFETIANDWRDETVNSLWYLAYQIDDLLEGKDHKDILPIFTSVRDKYEFLALKYNSMVKDNIMNVSKSFLDTLPK